MLNFEWYRTFKAIYQTGTLTGAAQELLISQPNVSQHLSSLESYIGQQLFERKPRKMVPTVYGKLFYTQIIEAVETLENVETHFRQDCLCSQLALTSIGGPKEFFHALLAEHINGIPSHIVVEFGVTRELMARLAKGELHFVLATHRTDEKNITYEPVLDERFLLVGGPGLDTADFTRHIAGGEMSKAEQWLAAQHWFAYNSDLMIIRRFWLRNFRKRPPLKPRFIIPDFDFILKAVSNGQGVTIASDYLVNPLLEQGVLKELWQGETATTNTIYLAYDPAKVTSQQVAMVRALFASMPAPQPVD
ncbi:LysR family transcriptional regulator [Chitinophaga japonensis]|uniref:DNA-binding transcriptional LysR family regulator n=1 Tax=Chitinophaga japonensis TaxID=104662 RepID=A0A562TCN7_CHIJA|nr:LysR family transcriptional regulator [Chitinophaga japonensis]TWI91038.1 DNA-binding transcriptional LysR family regulator [Chitinophaga japonensis]